MNQITRTLSMLAFALVFMTGAVFAQQNKSDVLQDGSDNDASVNQVGQSNLVDLKQFSSPFGTFTFPGAEASIEQIGTNNRVRLQQGGAADLQGTTWNGEATITMDGDNNLVGRRYRSSPPFGSNVNVRGALDIRDEVFIQKGDSRFDLDLVGSNNQIGVGAEQEFSEADLFMRGNNNNVGLFQKSFDQTNPHDADVTLDGNRNDVDVYQGNFGEATGNTAIVDITGNENDAQIGQGTGALIFPPPALPGTSSFNTATITMMGDNNRATINQSGTP